MRKNILVSVLLMCILLCMPVKADAKTTSKNWYKKVLSSKSATYKIGKKKYKRSSYKYYKLIDINKDGTKELILSRTKNNFLPYDSSALLLTYYNKKVKAVKSFSYAGGCALGYNSGKKALVFYKRDSGSSSYTAYQLKKGALKGPSPLILKKKGPFFS